MEYAREAALKKGLCCALLLVGPLPWVAQLTYSNRILSLTAIYSSRIDTEVDYKMPKVYKGRTACKGQASGPVLILGSEIPANKRTIDRIIKGSKSGFILVMDMTTPDIVPILPKVAGIATIRGGMLCHAAIIAREFNIPTVVGCTDMVAEPGVTVTVNADEGTVEVGL